MVKRVLVRVVVLSVAVLVGWPLQVRSDESRPAYLTWEGLLDLYQSMYSSIQNCQVTYTNTLVKYDRSSPSSLPFTGFESAEIIQEGEKYLYRKATTSGGFADANGVGHMAFDGSVSMAYWPSLRAGSVAPGMRKSPGNKLWGYMLIYKIQPLEDPNKIYLDTFFRGENSVVRPYLEQVSGQWCHVLHNPFSKKTVWMAVDKGGLPIKFEKYLNEQCVMRMLVNKVGSVQTDTGTLWYPQEAITEYNDKHGDRLYEFRMDSIRVNIPTTQDTFKVTFPPGTDVIDHAIGVDYEIGAEKLEFGPIEAAQEALYASAGPNTEISLSDKPPPDTAPDRSPANLPAKEDRPGRSTRHLTGPVAMTPLSKALWAVGVVICLSGLVFVLYRKVSSRRVG